MADIYFDLFCVLFKKFEKFLFTWKSKSDPYARINHSKYCLNINLFTIKEKWVAIFSHQVVLKWRRGCGSGIGALSFLIIKKIIFKKTPISEQFFNEFRGLTRFDYNNTKTVLICVSLSNIIIQRFWIIYKK